MIYQVLNPDRVKENFKCLQMRDNLFLKQISCSDMSIDEINGEFIQYGGYYHKYISLKTMPERTEPLMTRCLESLSFSDFHLVVNFEAPEKEWGRQKIESMRKTAIARLINIFFAGSTAQAVTGLIEEKSDDMTDAELARLARHIEAARSRKAESKE